MRKAKSEAIAVAKCIHNFLHEYAPIHLTRSKNTLKAYEIAISLFLIFIEERKAVSSSTLEWNNFSSQWIEDWISWLREERKCKPSSCNVRLGSLRTFLKYAGDHNPAVLFIYQQSTTVKKLKTTTQKVEGLTKKAVQILLEIPDQTTRTGRRDLTFMILIYSTATRISEILSLKINQIHLNEKKPYITVIGKRDKIRTAYLLPKGAAHIKQYILEFHGKDADSEAYLFFSRSGGTHTMLTQPAISKQLKKHAAQAHEICVDVPITLHAHQFRHAKASHWLEDGINIVQISFLLGHAQLQTTMIYLDISKEQELKALETLENEADKTMVPKWNTNNRSLKKFCGLNKQKI